MPGDRDPRRLEEKEAVSGSAKKPPLAPSSGSRDTEQDRIRDISTRLRSLDQAISSGRFPHEFLNDLIEAEAELRNAVNEQGEGSIQILSALWTQFTTYKSRSFGALLYARAAGPAARSFLRSIVDSESAAVAYAAAVSISVKAYSTSDLASDRRRWWIGCVFSGCFGHLYPGYEQQYLEKTAGLHPGVAPTDAQLGTLFPGEFWSSHEPIGGNDDLISVAKLVRRLTEDTFKEKLLALLDPGHAEVRELARSIAALGSANERIRVRVINILGESSTTEDFEVLRAMFTQESFQGGEGPAFTNLAIVLTSYKDKKSVVELFTTQMANRSFSEGRRSFLFQRMLVMDDAIAIAALVNLVGDSLDEARTAEFARTMVRRNVSGQNPEVRRDREEAILALGSHPKPEIRLIGIQAIAGGLGEKAKEILEHIVQRDEDQRVRAEASRLLSKLR